MNTSINQAEQRVEQQFQALRQQLNQVDTQAIQQRIETRLRSAWNNTSNNTSMANSTSPNASPKKFWRWPSLSFMLSGASLTALAIFTTFLINPTSTTPTISRNDHAKRVAIQQQGALDQELNYDLKVDEEPSYAGYEGYVSDDLVSPTASEAYTFASGEKPTELLDESVDLTIDVSGDILNTIQAVRSKVTSLQGYLINVSYTNPSGALQVKIPVDQLDAFQSYLKELDNDHNLIVDNYTVTNVSSEVVIIDENIKSAQTELDAKKEQFTDPNISATEKENLQDEIDRQTKYIEDQQTLRTETITKYNLVSVVVNMNQVGSIWSGNYTQYDRSTLLGSIQYETSKAIYSLVRSTSAIIRLIVWLALYSILYIPLYFLVRHSIRKLKAKFQTTKA